MQVYSCRVHASNPRVALHLQETLGLVFRQFVQLITRHQALDPQAMSRTDYALLATLEQCHAPAGQRTSHLAAALGQDASTVSRRLAHLEAQDLIERLPDPSDGRASTVRLTEPGRAALTEERSTRASLLAPVLEDWPQDDLVALDRLLTTLSEDLAARTLPGGTLPSPTATTARTSA